MTRQRAQLGKMGEDAAVAFLTHEGYRVVERNFRNSLGEIDIVAQEGDTICFIEVKTRQTQDFGSPFEAVTETKQRKLALVALSYLKARGSAEANARFDVISVLFNRDEDPHVEIVRNAFETFE